MSTKTFPILDCDSKSEFLMQAGYALDNAQRLEVFNALGDTIAVTVVPESLLDELTADEVLHVRSLAS